MAKSTLPEKEQRINAVYTMLLNGSTRLNILQHAAKTWGIETRQTDTYIAEAHAIIAQEAEYLRPREIGRAKARLDQVFGQAVADHDWSAAIAAQREISKLFSLYEPEAPKILELRGAETILLAKLLKQFEANGTTASEVFEMMLQQLAAADVEATDDGH